MLAFVGPNAREGELCAGKVSQSETLGRQFLQTRRQRGGFLLGHCVPHAPQDFGQGAHHCQGGDHTDKDDGPKQQGLEIILRDSFSPVKAHTIIMTQPTQGMAMRNNASIQKPMET